MEDDMQKVLEQSIPILSHDDGGIVRPMEEWWH
jgi:hypothetical protein